jgi:outer membrane receptor for ferrienterochelin and colicins
MAMLKGVFSLPHGNTLSTGLEYRYDYLNAPTRVEDGKANDYTGALYLQDEYNDIEWMSLTAGIRINQNKSFGFRATPKLSTMFSLGDFRLRMGWSQGFKTPTPKQLYYRYLRQMGQRQYYYMGNTDLKAQTSNYWTAGIEYRSGELTLSATGYVNNVDNMITLVNISVSDIPVGATQYLGDGSMDIVPRQYKNMEDAKTCGVDLNASYKLTRELTVGANYSYLDTDAHVYNSDHDCLRNVTIDGMAHHKWNAYATWLHRFCPKYKLGLGLYTRGCSKRYYQNDGNGKGYQIWKLNTTHDFGREGRKMTYRLECGVDNIFNHVDRTPRPYHLGTTTPPTAVYVAFSIRYNQGKSVNGKTTRRQTYSEEE